MVSRFPRVTRFMELTRVSMGRYMRLANTAASRKARGTIQPSTSRLIKIIRRLFSLNSSML